MLSQTFLWNSCKASFMCIWSIQSYKTISMEVPHSRGLFCDIILRLLKPFSLNLYFGSYIQWDNVARAKGLEFKLICDPVASVWIFYNPMDCNPPDFSVHGILQARIVEWVAISSTRGSSWPRDQTHVSWLAGGFFNCEPSRKPFSL